MKKVTPALAALGEKHLRCGLRTTPASVRVKKLVFATRFFWTIFAIKHEKSGFRATPASVSTLCDFERFYARSASFVFEVLMLSL